MKKVIVLACIMLVLLESCNNKNELPIIKLPTAIIDSNEAAFWFPVENVNQKWKWGVCKENELEYAWTVRINIMGASYEIGYTKWQGLGSKGSGNLKKLLFNGQVNIWILEHEGVEASVVPVTRDGIVIFQEGDGTTIKLTDQKFLNAIRSERPERVIFITKGAMLKYKKEEVGVTYKD